MKWLTRLLTLAGVALGAAAASAQAESVDVRIGYQLSDRADFYVARELGLFEEAGLAPEYIKFVSGPPMLAALRSGDVDIALMSANAAFGGLSQGIDMRVFWIDSDGLDTNGLVARPGSGIQKIEDLRGKTVGVTKGSASYYGLQKALVDNQMTDDVTVLDMSVPLWLPAFQTGDVDALWVWSPWLYKIAVEGNGKIVATLGSVGVTAAQNLWLGRAEWLDANPEGAQRLVAAIVLARQAIAEDPGLAVQSFVDTMGLTEDVAQRAFDDMHTPPIEALVDPESQYALVGEHGLAEGLAGQAEFLKNEGRLEAIPDMRRAMYPQAVQAYLENQKN